MTAHQEDMLARLAVAFAGLVWGVFWIPLRLLEAEGVTGAWATVPFFIIPLIVVLPMMLLRRRPLLSGGWPVHLVGLTSGLSMVLYADAMLETDVIRAILLFYMTPAWSVLLARFWLKEPIGRIRGAAIILGLIALWVVVGGDTGLTLDFNPGDGMALAAGIIWAVAATLMRRGDNSLMADYSLSYLLWGGLAAVIIALAGQPVIALPVAPLTTLAWLLPVVLLLVVPGLFAAFWGTPRLNPGTVGLLFMGEISVGTITAALWSGEPFGPREMIGVALITLAGILEILPLAWMRRRRQRAGV